MRESLIFRLKSMPAASSGSVLYKLGLSLTLLIIDRKGVDEEIVDEHVDMCLHKDLEGPDVHVKDFGAVWLHLNFNNELAIFGFKL